MSPIFNEKTRDGEIARALNLALHALSVYSGAIVLLDDSKPVTLNLSYETAAILRAMQLLGMKPGETLPAPNLDDYDLGDKNVPRF
ncbi:hypothetical protein [Caballeronia sp. RCC_10]|uniref:hypothetical protein n=1 Tax=Caballeronia sp. RCC_10 TaxID=3239227 RepID=UPI003525D6E0